MKRIELKEQKQIQLDILDSVTNFCEQHGLRYWLAYGTLLGAVRHRGYIPWDDDIDIHMPRADYERFLEIYGKNQEYKIITPQTNSNYTVPFAKVFHAGTIMEELKYTSCVFGVYIDIFPLDGVLNVSQAAKCAQCRRFLFVKSNAFVSDQSLVRKLRLAITKALLFPFSKRFFLNKIHKVATKAAFDDSENVCSMYSRAAVKEIMPRSVFAGDRRLPFEGRMLRVPQDYDKYLTCNYGDYMQLPPEEKRASTHESKAFWK